VQKAAQRGYQTLAIALVCCVAPVVMAADFEVSGQQEIRVGAGAAESGVMATTFTLARLGSNWAIHVFYTNAWARAVTQECITMVDGRSYSAEWAADGTCGGLVMDVSNRLDGATEFIRVLAGAFLLSKERNADSLPVGFLPPRHPALHCYQCEVARSTESPWLPQRIRFRLDDTLCDQVPSEAVSDFFRSGSRDWSLFRRWRETQKSGAEYSVSAWTNWGELTLPQRATLTHNSFEHSPGERSFSRVHILTVTKVQVPASATLVPMLLPGSSVQEVTAGANYLYTSTDGTFLPEGQAKSVGTRLRKSPVPGSVAALAQVRSLPWASLLWIAPVLLLAGIAWCWFTRQR